MQYFFKRTFENDHHYGNLQAANNQYKERIISKRRVFAVYLNQNNSVCSCGKIHECALEQLIVGKNALLKLPAIIRQYGLTRVFMRADANTYTAAGKQTEDLLYPKLPEKVRGACGRSAST